MHISLFGSYGEKNLGDEAICASVINNIFSVCEDAKITIFSHNPKETAHKYEKNDKIDVRPVIASGFRSFYRQIKSKEFHESLAILKKSNFVIIGGGGLLYDTELNVGINPIFVWLIRVLIFKYIRVKIIIYAIGVGPIHSIISKVFLRILGNNVQKISVRDDYSKSLFEKCGVYTPVIVTADPVWTVRWEERSMQDISKNSILKIDGRRKIGIQIRKVKGISEVAFVNLMTEFIDRMIEKYLLSVVLIPMSFDSPNDLLLMEKIQINSSFESKIEIYNTENYKGISAVMQECEFLVVARMHSMIIATQLGIPYIALSYSPKTDDLIERLEVQDFSWPISQIDPTLLERMYLKVMKQRVSVRKFLLEKATYMEKQAYKNLDLVRNNL